MEEDRRVINGREFSIRYKDGLEIATIVHSASRAKARERASADKGRYAIRLLEEAMAKDRDLSRTFMRRANLAGLDLRRFNFSMADLRGADLRGADLREAILKYADLRNADLIEANLEGACIDFTDLRGAKLGGHILTYTNGVITHFNGVGVKGLSWPS